MRDKDKLDIALLEELLRNQRKILRKQKKRTQKGALMVNDEIKKLKNV
jgi:hypothetical protein